MTEILSVNQRDPDHLAIQKAAQFMKDGNVVAYPTETFYGLGVDMYNEKAIKKLFKLKQRDYGLPIAILVSDMEMLSKVVREIPDSARQLIRSFWPGALTILFPAHASVSKSLTTNTGKIGVRISSNPVATALVVALGGPITTTSANLSSFPPSLNVKHIQNYFHDKLACILDAGECEPTRGSTVVDVSDDTMAIIREGAVPAEDVIKKFQES